MSDEHKSLAWCTVKKSVSVSKFILETIFEAVVVAGIIAIASIFWFEVACQQWPVVVNAYAIISAIFVEATMIPWYYYAGFAAVMSIPAYSFLWCINRELTEEDWEAAKNYDGWLYVLIVGGICYAISVWLWLLILPPSTQPYTREAFAGTVSLITGGMLLVGIGMILSPYEMFPVAVYNHYFKK